MVSKEVTHRRSASQPQKTPRKGDGKKREKKMETEWEKQWKKMKWNMLYFFRQHWLIICSSAFIFLLLIALYLAGDTLDFQKLPSFTDTVTFDFAINGTQVGSVDIGLFGTICPLTVKNFIMLATHEKGYGYVGSRIHSVLPMHIMVGGDLVHGNGTGGRGALGQPFENENFQVKHVGPGYVGMLTIADNRNSSRSSQFYITINAMPRFDRHSVAFGKVTRGMEVIKKIEGTDIDKEMRPLLNVTIVDAKHKKLN